MATLKGRSWRTSSGSWRWPGKEQASWVQGCDTGRSACFQVLPLLSPVLFFRTLQTPHSEKRWKSSCRSLTKTKMDELRCQRWEENMSTHTFAYWKSLLYSIFHGFTLITGIKTRHIFMFLLSVQWEDSTMSLETAKGQPSFELYWELMQTLLEKGSYQLNICAVNYQQELKISTASLGKMFQRLKKGL